MQLSVEQQRVIGCFLEKQTTTPEHYPLSLNALTNACNQKSNRAPVLELSQQQVQATIAELIDLRLVTEDEGLSGRVSKYDHRFCNTQFSHLQFNAQQRAIICLLLLRGAQTPGELKTRCARLADFTSIDDVEISLEQLIENSHVKKLPRESGKRDSRYIHLFTVPSAENDEPIATQTITDELKNQELNDLLAEINELKAQLKQIKEYIGL
ncbi:YceH family protein [Pseudoalteromonas sp. US3C1013]|uniref:YceH family protein n=1 Tax=unclassified Pseudoalteromonas TaxID=194690 RepID=UPI003AB238DF